MPRETRRLRIQGLVQGVGYRYFFLNAANGLGLTGWVRNRRDGSVEAVVQGDAETVAEMVRLARRGPGMSRVDHIDESFAEGDFGGFEVRDTD